ncbi:MAG: hypothetical protein HZB57_06645, partial [Gammaproteobacteria bacterium]|nr:hypothetical protein [Gammaproteobacteria bacterium]
MFLAAGAAACLVAGSATHAWTALYTANALGLLALLWIALDARFAYTPLALVIVVALAPRLIAVFADPLFEDDWYRYLWDGLTSLASGDPYRLPPAAAFGDATLSPAQQALLSGINHPELPTIYGPALQALFTAAAWIAPAELWPLKAMLLAVDLATLALLTHLGVQTRWLLVYAVHPLIARETLANAHPDGLVGLLLLATLVAWRARYAVGVGICFGAALATKVAALVVLPLLMREPHARRPGLWIITLGLTATASVSLLYLPFLAGGTDLASLAVFARARRSGWLADGEWDSVVALTHERVRELLGDER